MGRFRKFMVIGVAGVVGLSLLGGTVLTRPGSQHVSDEFSSVLDGLVLDEAVAAGEITAEQAEQVLANFQTRVTTLLESASLSDGQHKPKRDRSPVAGIRSAHQIIGGTADILGIEPQDLIEQLRDGATLVEIIEANGLTVDAVVQELSARLQARLDEAIAAGQITTEQAENVLANFQTQAASAIESGAVGRARQGNQGSGHGSRFDNSDDEGRAGRRVGSPEGRGSRFQEVSETQA